MKQHDVRLDTERGRRFLGWLRKRGTKIAKRILCGPEVETQNASANRGQDLALGHNVLEHSKNGSWTCRYTARAGSEERLFADGRQESQNGEITGQARRWWPEASDSVLGMRRLPAWAGTMYLEGEGWAC